MLNRVRRTQASAGLPETHQVALDVLEVRRVAHLADLLATQDLAAAEALDLLEGGVDVVDVDGDHRAVGGRLALEHAAADEAGLGRSAVIGARTGLHDRVVHVRDLVDHPPEGVGVELAGPVPVVEGDLEVNDASSHGGQPSAAAAARPAVRPEKMQPPRKVPSSAL